MLNSILNREKRRITLNQIMVTDSDLLYIFTDQSDIDHITMMHFQIYANIFSDNIFISPDWLTDVNLKDHINATVY